MDDVAILIVGYPEKIENLEKIYKKFLKYTKKENIFISSYSDRIPSDISENLIINDYILGKYDMDIYSGSLMDKLLKNVNYFIIQSLKGVKFIKETNKYKYIFVIRTDVMIEKNIGKHINNMKYLVDNNKCNNDILNNKIIVIGKSTKHFPPHQLNKWYISEVIKFGLVDDILKIYDIPLKLNSKYQNCNFERYVSSAFIKKFYNHDFKTQFNKIDSDNSIIDTDYYEYYPYIRRDMSWMKYNQEHFLEYEGTMIPPALTD